MRVVDASHALCPTPAHRAPLLSPFYALLEDMYQYLGKDDRNAVVITCQVMCICSVFIEISSIVFDVSIL